MSAVTLLQRLTLQGVVVSHPLHLINLGNSTPVRTTCSLSVYVAVCICSMLALYHGPALYHRVEG
jgi:hypothetical protein